MTTEEKKYDTLQEAIAKLNIDPKDGPKFIELVKVLFSSPAIAKTFEAVELPLPSIPIDKPKSARVKRKGVVFGGWLKKSVIEHTVHINDELVEWFRRNRAI